MRLKMRCVILFLAFAMCLNLAACTAPVGPRIYGLNATWEAEGNAVTLLSVDSVHTYCAPDGSTYDPGEGKAFLAIQCRLVLLDGWAVSQDTKLRGLSSADPTYPLFCAPIPVSNVGKEQEYIMLFSIEKGAYPEITDSNWLHMEIVQWEDSKISQEFELRSGN